MSRGVICAIAALVCAVPARAQTQAAPDPTVADPTVDDPTLPEPPLPAPRAEPKPEAKPAAAAAPVNSRGILMPLEKSSDIQLHWSARRQYVQERDERRADDEEQRVRALKDDLAIENLFFIGGALVRESQQALAQDPPATALAVQRCKLAVEFAPALPEAHLCLARATLSDNLTNVKPAFDALATSASVAMNDPRVGHASIANLLAVVFAGLASAGVLFVLVLFFRYAKLYAHDVHHLFPAGARRWQTKMLAAVLLLLPIFLQMGALPLVFTLLLACALYVTTAELVLSVLLLCLLAASPWAAQAISRVAAFGGPSVDVWLVEHGLGTGPEIARLQKRLDIGNELSVDFALAHKAKRDGDLATAEKLYLRALEAPGSTSLGIAGVHNNLGNVYLLEGDTAKALAEYQKAVDIREGLAAPHFNISRALGMGGVETLDKVQSEMKRAQDLDEEVRALSLGPANRRANKFVLDMPLDEDLLAPLNEAEARVADPVGDELRAQLAAGLPADWAWVLPLLVAVGVLALNIGKSRIRPSGRCERCGREVCKRCDPDARPSEALCAQCVNVFIRRTGVDAAERIRKEYAVQTYHRRRHAVARALAVLSGAGHVIMGYPIRGMIYLVATGALLASVVLWRGFFHDPIAVRSGISYLRLGTTIALFIAVYAACLRDLLARQRAEEGG
ncbi:MAG TPA: tetratricopeptide repeat protein [Myxococcales bacterium]|nr:tetratricopeptide repeat protein [Myxococcales bacterium]